MVNLTFHEQFLLKVVANYGGHAVPQFQRWQDANTSVVLSAPSISPYAFVNWSTPSTGVSIHNPTSATTSVILSAPGTLFANYV